MLPLLLACAHPVPPAVPVPPPLADHCREAIGAPRIETIGEGIFLAIGWDLANTILIQTDTGRVVIDTGMSPTRAAPMREALDAVSHGPIEAVIFTHSHIDHVGGASVWVEEDTEVWGTDGFIDHFFAQYSLLLPSQTDRGAHQFGMSISEADLPCSAIGRRVDLQSALNNGARLPTHTFDGQHTLHLGGRTIELIEAHGETHDQLFVYLPEAGVLMPGDNWYRAFPNLYTLRGTRPRPVADWIASLDAMRALDPAILVPSHTAPVMEQEATRAALRDYRDGIQWVHDSVVRTANAGADLDGVAAGAALPPHLAAVPALAERYGQVDWSAWAIYTNELGWFDERIETLYPMTAREEAEGLIALMGGSEAVLTSAQASTDPRMKLRLLTMLERTGVDTNLPIAAALEALAEQTENTNGRGYLLEAAAVRRGQATGLSGQPVLSPDFLTQMPISALFSTMATKLRAADTLSVHATIRFEFSDHPTPFILTIRRGVLEVIAGDPLPGTPEPGAVVHTDTLTWKRRALGDRTPLSAVSGGALQIEGERSALTSFLDHFDKKLTRH